MPSRQLAQNAKLHVEWDRRAHWVFQQSVARVGSKKGKNRVRALRPVLELELAETTKQADLRAIHSVVRRLECPLCEWRLGVASCCEHAFRNEPRGPSVRRGESLLDPQRDQKDIHPIIDLCKMRGSHCLPHLEELPKQEAFPNELVSP